MASTAPRSAKGRILRHGGLAAAARFVNDIASDPLWSPTPLARHTASPPAGPSPCSMPTGTVLGTFAVYARRAGPMPGQLQPLLTLVQTAAIAIRKKRDEHACAKANALDPLLDAAGHGVWDWNLVTGRVFFGALEIDARQRTRRRSTSSTNGPRAYIPTTCRGRRNSPTTCAEPPVYRSEHRMRCKDGSWKWILDQGMAVERPPAARAARHRHAYRHQRLARQYRELNKLQLAVAQVRTASSSPNRPASSSMSTTPSRNDWLFTRGVLGRRAGFQRSGPNASANHSGVDRPECWRNLARRVHQPASRTAKPRSFSPYFPVARRTVESRISSPIQEDITERKRTAEELDRHRHHLQELVAERTADLEEANRRPQVSDARLNALFEMSQKAPDLDEEALQLGVDEAVRLTGSAIGYLHLVHEDQENVRLYLWSSGTYAHCDALPLSHYPLSSAGIWADAPERQPVMHNDFPG